MTTNLPEFSRLEFVLATPALQDLKEFVDSQRNIHQPILYQGDFVSIRIIYNTTIKAIKQLINNGMKL